MITNMKTRADMVMIISEYSERIVDMALKRSELLRDMQILKDKFLKDVESFADSSIGPIAGKQAMDEIFETYKTLAKKTLAKEPLPQIPLSELDKLR